MIGIIDYGSGNVGAIANIYKQLKVPFVVSGDPAVLAPADRYILPGVGAFDTTMSQLRGSGLVGMLEDQVRSCGKKLLGICVGMQVLAEGSDEGDQPGLGWIPGWVRKISPPGDGSRFILPHMGWNDVEMSRESPLLVGVDAARGFYFLHSYHFETADDTDVIATVKYGCMLTCGVSRDGVSGLQFHPEKSHSNGVAVFRNFVEC